MNNVLALRAAAHRTTTSRAETNLPSRHAALTNLLHQAAATDGDVLYPLLAHLLDAHMDHGHHDERANARIRDGLDQLELLLALDIERQGLRHSPETPRTVSQP